MASAFMQPTHP